MEGTAITVMSWYGDGSPGGWTWILMAVGMIVLWGLIIWAIVWLAGSSPPGEGGTATRPSPEDVLADRLARGDIEGREYQERLEVLHSNHDVLARH